MDTAVPIDPVELVTDMQQTLARLRRVLDSSACEAQRSVAADHLRVLAPALGNLKRALGRKGGDHVRRS
jgi:hypothetical protein